MEGSESGALVPSDTSLEVETWVKLCNFPAEFLTADALSMIGSSFGSPVMMDEDTDEKVENHKWPPKLRRKLHSRKTFVRILVRVSVTKPLPSRVAVICPKGREYIIRLEFEPTPKVCLLCFGAGHFDFECCGTDKVSVVAEAGVGFVEVNGVAVEDVLGVDLQLGDCCDSMSDEVDGEQGAVTIDGVESFENSVVEAVLFPAATCDFDDAVVGELGADHAIVDGLLEQSLVERTVVALEVQPLLPATIAADGSEGTIISDGFVCYEDPPVVEAVLEIENLECEIQEKQKQMKVLKQRMVENGEASVASASMVEMQQTITKLMAQCSEKGFELEIKSADNRVLQEQLQNKCTENKELEEKVLQLEQQLTSVSSDNKPSSSENCVHDEYTEELRKKVQLQDKPAFIFCVEDRALFCKDCDEPIHSANSRAANHQRFLATGIRVALGSSCSKENAKSDVEPKPPPKSSSQQIGPKTTPLLVPGITSPSWGVDDLLQLSDYSSPDKVEHTWTQIFAIQLYKCRCFHIENDTDISCFGQEVVQGYSLVVC